MAAISKTQETKNGQGYTKKPMQCNNCAHYRSEVVEMQAVGFCRAYSVEKNKRCGVGGFAVQSSASCRLYCAAD